MTDFSSILRQSLQQRGATTPDERERIYAHARSLMIRRLWAIQPPLSSAEIDDNIRRFNAAVDQVEREHVARPPRVEATARYDWSGEGGPVRRPQPQANNRPNGVLHTAPAAAGRTPHREAQRPVGQRGAIPPRPEPAVAPEPRVQAQRVVEQRDRWRQPDPERREAVGMREPAPEPAVLRDRASYPEPPPRARRPRGGFDVAVDDLVDDPAQRRRPRRRSVFARLFAIGITGLTAAVVVWCGIVLYPILAPVNQAARVDSEADRNVSTAELKPIPPARQVLAPPGEGGTALGPTVSAAQANPPAGQVAAGPTAEPAASTPPVDTRTQESFVVFDGRDPTVFDAVSDNPIQFNGDIQGGFARITSTTGSAGVRAIVGPGLAQQLAGRRVRVTVVARSSILGGAGSIRIAYESGATLSPWKNVRLAPDYAPIELVWDIPADRNARANDYVIIEPGLPGDGASADIRWIRIETLPS